MGLEDFEQRHQELLPLFTRHFEEYRANMRKKGIETDPLNPRWDEYFKANRGGWMLTFVLRCEGVACGYCMIYVTNDMHNHEKVAQEDTLYVVPEHRNGIGRKFTLFGLEELRKRGVKRFTVSASTDRRIAPLWKRMGFKEAATQMVYTF